MYLDFFGLKDLPFSIAPDPRFLYMSERHREALAHLLYGVSGQGGFIVLTGEVGTGKTTICRCFLNQIPKNTEVAFIINPKLSARELMASICDEFKITYPASASIKTLNDLINGYLLQAHSENRHTVLIIDEAQNLRIDVLEQLRLLTNLETSEKKLLQIILLGQTELRELLAQKELRQLAQRVTARYHLTELNKVEVGAYVQCRLMVAGRRGRLFSLKAINCLYRVSGGVPRLINLIADRALLGAYAAQAELVEPLHIKLAYREIHGEKVKVKRRAKHQRVWLWPALVGGFALGMIGFGLLDRFYPVTDQVVSAPELEPQSDGAVLALTDQSAQSNPSLAVAAVSSDSAAGANNSGTNPQSEGPSAISTNTTELINLDDLKVQSTDKFFAYQAVFSRWQVDYQDPSRIAVCDFAEMQGLRCLNKSGNWRSLLKLNSPAVLTLVNSLGEELYLGLLRVEGDRAQVSFQGKSYTVELAEIDRYWLGDFSIMWKLPPYKSMVIVPGQPVDEKQWLTERLTEIEQSNFYGNSKVSNDQSLASRIKRFQQQVGLVPDGIAGSMTLIHMNNRLPFDCPTLLDRN